MLYCTVTSHELLRMAERHIRTPQQRAAVDDDIRQGSADTGIDGQPVALNRTSSIWSPGRRRSWVTITLLASITML